MDKPTVTSLYFPPIWLLSPTFFRKHKNYFLAYMLSAIIKFIRSYSTMLVKIQSIYQWYTFLNPLVQKKRFFSFQ